MSQLTSDHERIMLAKRIASGEYARVIARLLDPAPIANLGACDPETGETLLHRAVLVSTAPGLQMLQLLVERGIDVDTPCGPAESWERNEAGEIVPTYDRSSMTALHRAALFGRGPAVAALIDLGADVNRLTGNGCTALHLAATVKAPEVLTALVAAGARLDARNEAGFTALHHACSCKSLGQARHLISLGASLDIQSHDGELAEHLRQGEPEWEALFAAARAERAMKRVVACGPTPTNLGRVGL